MSANKRAKIAVAPVTGETERLTCGFFPNGHLSSDSKGSADLDVVLARGEEQRRASQRHLTVDTKLVRYVGRHVPSLDDQDVRYMVAVHDKAAKRVTMYDTRLFRMTATVKNDQLRNMDNTNVTALKTRDQIMSARAGLITTFGGKKKKQALIAEERNKIEEDVLSAKAQKIQMRLDELQMPETVSQGEGSGVATDHGMPIPPFNADATVPSEAYPMDHLIPPAEMSLLAGLSKVLFKCTPENIASWRGVRRYPEFVLECLESPPADRKTQAKLLMYISWLFRFRHALSRRGGLSAADAEAQLQDMPEVTRARLISLFAEESTSNSGDKVHIMSSRKEDTLIAYILVLAMAARGFDPLPLDTLVADLRMPLPKLMQAFKTLGAKIESHKMPAGGEQSEDGPAAHEGRTATLQVPLKFPKVGRGKAKR
eukprot:m.105075 g.105075  ORF g.105075 m.105075 type:complete len:427 (-) comp15779_c0_seq1:120-1400(-)